MECVPVVKEGENTVCCWSDFVKEVKQNPYKPPLWCEINPAGHWMQMIAYHTCHKHYTRPNVAKTLHIRLPKPHQTCCLEYFEGKEAGGKSTKVCLLLFPTISGSSKDLQPLIEHVCNHLHWLVICINKSGQHCPTKDGHFDMIGHDTETDVLVRKAESILQTRFREQVRLVALGVSAGGIMLTRYLSICGRDHKSTPIHAAVSISTGFNLDMVRQAPSFLRNHLKQACQNKFRSSQGGEDEKKQKEELWHYAHRSSAHWKERPFQEFLEGVTLQDKLKHICTPLLFIHAKDDLIFGWDESLKAQIRASKYMHLLLTEKGSHGVFLRDYVGFRQVSWAELVALRFLQFQLGLQHISPPLQQSLHLLRSDGGNNRGASLIQNSLLLASITACHRDLMPWWTEEEEDERQQEEEVPHLPTS